MRYRFQRNGGFIPGSLLCTILALAALSGTNQTLAVTSKVTRHSSSEDMLKGEIENVVIDSQGTIKLGTAAETLVEKFEKDPADIPSTWSINSIVVSGPSVYVGTSPNGGIYEYSLGKLTKIYPPRDEETHNKKTENKPSDVNLTAEPNDPNVVRTEEYLTNEHIFAMTTDVSGRLLAGISGKKCELLRLEDGKMNTIFEPNDAKYIFAITLDESGKIYLGTGPDGKIFQLDPFGKNARIVYDSLDKNVLSLAVGQDNFIYAGSDSRGLIYRIDPRTQTAAVLYDSDQPEITALLFGPQAELYAAATSAKIVETQAKFASPPSLPGRPEAKPNGPKTDGLEQHDTGLQLKIPNAKKAADEESPTKQIPVLKGAKPEQVSHIYRVSKEGYVKDIFTEPAVLFAMAQKDRNLLVGTGNNAQLFTIDPALEHKAVIYEDKQAAQITAVAVSRDDVYLGTANPVKLIRLGKTLAAQGEYTSALVDAGQPAKWGKLQIEADIPTATAVLAASRSGNVDDVNDPTFSPWTEPVAVTGPTQLRCPLGRFCQYKLVLKSSDGMKSPLVREVAVAHTVPNLAPNVESVSIDRLEGKPGVFKVGYKVTDDNDDKLIYKMDFRKLGRANWIQIEDDVESDTFEWDGKTVEDGRYEIRVTAGDERSNTAATSLTGSRVSDPVVVDNTGPFVKKFTIDRSEKSITLKIEAADELSVIGKAHYTVDSNDKWIGVIPDDLVFDTTEENFTVLIEDLEAGEHVISLRISDDVGNTTYKSFEVTVPDD